MEFSNGGQLVRGGFCHFKSSPGASAVAVIIETALKGVSLCPLNAEMGFIFSALYLCFGAATDNIQTTENLPRGFTKNKILNLISRNACVDYQDNKYIFLKISFLCRAPPKNKHDE